MIYIDEYIILIVLVGLFVRLLYFVYFAPGTSYINTRRGGSDCQ